MIIFPKPRRRLILFLKAEGEWITVHPNGPGTTGQPVLVKDGVIVGGAGGKLDGTEVGEPPSTTVNSYNATKPR